jgi:hypothetical protein
MAISVPGLFVVKTGVSDYPLRLKHSLKDVNMGEMVSLGWKTISDFQ